MNYYKINFLFKDKDADTEKTNDKLYVYLSCLFKNGNALRDYKLIKKEDRYEAYIAIYEHYPPLKNESNKYIEKYELELREVFDITWEMLGELDGFNEVCTCEKPKSYLMFTTQFDEEYLILCGDCCGMVPLYRLPYLDEWAEEYLDLIGWQECYRSMDKIWLQAPNESMERSAVYQLHNPKSPISVLGRDFCKQIEEKTGTPTYYYLFNNKKHHKVCPQCHKPWREEEDGAVDFYCDDCRLATDR